MSRNNAKTTKAFVKYVEYLIMDRVTHSAGCPIDPEDMLDQLNWMLNHCTRVAEVRKNGDFVTDEEMAETIERYLSKHIRRNLDSLARVMDKAHRKGDIRSVDYYLTQGLDYVNKFGVEWDALDALDPQEEEYA